MLYYFDAEAEKWTKTIDLEHNVIVSNDSPIKTVGKYLLFTVKSDTGFIYNMETDELVADDIPEIFSRTFSKT